MKISGGEPEPTRYRWLVLFASLFAFIAYAFAFQAAPPLILSVMAEFAVSNAQASLTMAFVLLPGIFLTLPAGLLVGRYGIKHVGFASLICVILGSLVTAMANSFVTLLIGRLILGIGGSMIVTAAPATIAQWFKRRELGRAMGIFGINMPLATVIAFPTSSLLLLAYGWRFPFYVSLSVGVVAAIVFMVVIKEGPFVQRKKTISIHLLRDREIWKLGLVWLFFNAAALSFTAWGPTLLEKFQSMPKVQAGFLASLLSWAAIFTVPVYGYLSDKTGKRKPFALLGAVLMALVFVALAFTSNVLLASSIVALGIAAAMIPPIVSSLPPEILGPSLASEGFGVTGMCANIGAALAQPFLGLLLDYTQSYIFCMLSLSALSVVGAIAAYSLKTN